MKRALPFVYAIFTLLSIPAFAGSFSGGGGGTVVTCTSKSTGELTKIELLDLAFYLHIGKSKRAELLAFTDAEAIFAAAAEEERKVSAYEGEYLARRGTWLLKSATYVPKLGGVPFDVNPALVNTLKYGGFCSKKEVFGTRLVAYQDFAARKVTLDSTIWNHAKFGAFSKAALVYHEAWYAYLFDAAGIEGPERPDYLDPDGIYSKVGERFLTR